MNKFAMFLIAGSVFGLISLASAARPPDYMKDLNQWLGRDDSYFEDRWDPDAERFAQFENEMRNRIERFYRDQKISRREYRELRDQLASFDDRLRKGLNDGELSWTEKRLLETEQEEVKGNVQEALLNREYYPYRRPQDFEAFDRMEKPHEGG